MFKNHHPHGLNPSKSDAREYILDFGELVLPRIGGRLDYVNSAGRSQPKKSTNLKWNYFVISIVY